jgi:hypothetical protein
MLSLEKTLGCQSKVEVWASHHHGIRSLEMERNLTDSIRTINITIFSIRTVNNSA